MYARLAIRPFTNAIRQAHHGHAPAPVKFQGPQTPAAFVHDGWATARLPFNTSNKWLFAVKAIAFLSVGFWAPFIVVEYQLRKANSQ